MLSTAGSSGGSWQEAPAIVWSMSMTFCEEQTTDSDRSDIHAVCERYKRHPSTVWLWYTKGDFPKPHYLHNRRYWWNKDLDAFDENQIQTFSQRQQQRRKL